MKPIEIYCVVFSALYSALAFDALFKGRYKLYYYGNDPGVHYIDFLFRLCLYPLTCLVFLNMFPRKNSRMIKVLYFIGWVLLMTLMEWGLLQLSVIKYDGWRLYYTPLKFGLIFYLALLSWMVTKKFAKQSNA
ncbi:CBO0543 family protein [Bacillus sp. P14.5]|uniref:CBO0543 family protein n=1 Tax=Bacillus sp. P14.5 TaxID=1983400 RepID=UPI001962ABD1|nr:CBO0543 family protein [Bacillus sp. P14.5]